MGDLLARYEEWVLSMGTRPTLALMLIVYTLLSVVTLIGYRAWTRSLRAWFWFGLTNVGVWSYLYWSSTFSPSNRDHFRLFLIHAIVVTGGWFTVMLASRIVFGREDFARRDKTLPPKTT